MRIMIFTWEFPPRIIGALSHYVNVLAVELVRRGVDTHVVTYHDSWTGYHEGFDSVKAHRISNPIKTQINIMTWALTLNAEVERVASNNFYLFKGQIDLVDVHDWHFIPAATNLKKALNLPFIFSLNSLEDHRSHGSNAPLSLSIKSIEWLGAYEAERLVVKSEWMKEEAKRIYKVPVEKLGVVSPYSSSWINDILKNYAEVTNGNLKKSARTTEVPL